jgi:hypothetical protein
VDIDESGRRGIRPETLPVRVVARPLSAHPEPVEAVAEVLAPWSIRAEHHVVSVRVEVVAAEPSPAASSKPGALALASDAGLERFDALAALQLTAAAAAINHSRGTLAYAAAATAQKQSPHCSVSAGFDRSRISPAQSRDV